MVYNMFFFNLLFLVVATIVCSFAQGAVSDDQIQGLVQQMDLLTRRVGTLEEEKSLLTRRVGTLEEEKSLLYTKKVATLKEENDVLISRVGALEERENQLEENFTKLEEEKNQLEKKFNLSNIKRYMAVSNMTSRSFQICIEMYGKLTLFLHFVEKEHF